MAKFSIEYGMYDYNQSEEFKSLSQQCGVEYAKEEKQEVELTLAESFVSQDMKNPQLDLDVPTCKCLQK